MDSRGASACRPSAPRRRASARRASSSSISSNRSLPQRRSSFPGSSEGTCFPLASRLPAKSVCTSGGGRVSSAGGSGRLHVLAFGSAGYDLDGMKWFLTQMYTSVASTCWEGSSAALDGTASLRHTSSPKTRRASTISARGERCASLISICTYSTSLAPTVRSEPPAPDASRASARRRTSAPVRKSPSLPHHAWRRVRTR